jgi:amino-acid N-acetyltransferase
MTETLIDLRPATQEDWPKIKVLLAHLKLPTDDIAEGLKGFFVAYQGNLLVGTVGVEQFGELGMLRSLAVNREFRSQNLGTSLYQKAEAYARHQGIKQLYLITIAAQHYFGAKGYQALGRDQVPLPIQSTPQFSQICPTDAAIMVKLL